MEIKYWILIVIYIIGYIICNWVLTKSVDWEVINNKKKSGRELSDPIMGAYMNIAAASFIWFLVLFMGLPYLLRVFGELKTKKEDEAKTRAYKQSR